VRSRESLRRRAFPEGTGSAASTDTYGALTTLIVSPALIRSNVIRYEYRRKWLSDEVTASLDDDLFRSVSAMPATPFTT
jgi:hypothetical protein